MWVVLPIKQLENAKTRLAPMLSPTERTALFRCMVHDVMAAVADFEAREGFVVVTSDPEMRRLAQTFGACVLEDRSNGGHSVAIEQAIHWLLARGSRAFMQIPGDIPLVTPQALSRVLSSHAAENERELLTIVPSHDSGGSNCVVCAPPDVLPLQFGEDSFRRHLAAARAAGIRVRIANETAIALDVDEPKDLARLAAMPGNTRTHHFLAESGVGHRVLAMPVAARLEQRVII